LSLHLDVQSLENLIIHICSPKQSLTQDKSCMNSLKYIYRSYPISLIELSCISYAVSIIKEESIKCRPSKAQVMMTKALVKENKTAVKFHTWKNPLFNADKVGSFSTKFEWKKEKRSFVSTSFISSELFNWSSFKMLIFKKSFITFPISSVLGTKKVCLGFWDETKKIGSKIFKIVQKFFQIFFQIEMILEWKFYHLKEKLWKSPT